MRQEVRRKVPRLDTALTIFGMPVGALLGAFLGGLIVLQIVQMLISQIWLRGIISLVAAYLTYKLSLLVSDRFGNGVIFRFLKFITRADVYEPSAPMKEVPLTLSRAGLPEPEDSDLHEEEEVRYGFA